MLHVQTIFFVTVNNLLHVSDIRFILNDIKFVSFQIYFFIQRSRYMDMLRMSRLHDGKESKYVI